MPDDATPPSLTTDALRTLVAPVGALATAERLEGGQFATTYRVGLAGGGRVVVKTAPADSPGLLTHERDLIRTEAAVYALAADRPDLLMPALLHTDFSREVVPGDVVVAAHLDGVPWAAAGFGAPAEDPRAARAQADLGALLGRIGTVTGERFGYPHQPLLQATTWRAAFTAVVGALLADAERGAVPGIPADRVRAALAAHAGALDEVTVPRLVHTDLWPGNLFVDPATGALLGVIDPERALWGDPLLDLVGADPMWDGLPAALVGDRDVTSPGAAARLLLARMWLGLVMTIEAPIRGYQGDWVAGYDAANRRSLARALDGLGV
ncbi:phosphotransferase family protein [Cellulomonas sp. PS-H5]|uniref:phosphotransferase family protein n=1 Tax=Cellulomonas sp. PS-H5 TaxID=2820400 RepID=UPI001C4E854C|nr:aminoglycoside phosphotransferase family protein [Cellulomonas sp. PS-H5]MBW0255334.1 aminoglycoside phosphotransferase family protein [Cellulomonas sp. PS-H5]